MSDHTLKPSLVEWKHVKLSDGEGTVRILETFLGGMETQGRAGEHLRPSCLLETFLGGMETPMEHKEIAALASLETFLGGMETPSPSVGNVASGQPLKPSLVEWKLATVEYDPNRNARP